MPHHHSHPRPLTTRAAWQIAWRQIRSGVPRDDVPGLAGLMMPKAFDVWMSRKRLVLWASTYREIDQPWIPPAAQRKEKSRDGVT